MKVFVTCVMMLALCLTANFLLPAEAQESEKTWGETTKTTETPADPTTVAAAPKRTLSLLQARKLGITLQSVRKEVEELKAAGEIDSSMSRAEIAALVTDRLSNKNQAAFKAAGASLDWEAILNFIEKLLPIILKLLGI